MKNYSCLLYTSSPRDLYVVTYSVSDRQPLVVNVKETPEGEIGDMLMASAYLIGFRPERLGGKLYMEDVYKRQSWMRPAFLRWRSAA